MKYCIHILVLFLTTITLKGQSNKTVPIDTALVLLNAKSLALFDYIRKEALNSGTELSCLNYYTQAFSARFLKSKGFEDVIFIEVKQDKP